MAEPVNDPLIVTDPPPTAPPADTKKGTGKLMAAGKPEVIKGTITPTPGDNENSPGATKGPDAKIITDPPPIVPPAGAAVEITDEQLAKYFEAKGIKYEGLEKLKEKVDYTPPPPEPTDEEKLKKAQAKEKKSVDLFVKNGGTVAQFVAIKNVAESDLTELSLRNLKLELAAAGFGNDEVEDIIKERYFQLEDSLIEQYEDETDKAYAKRKKEYGAKKLANRSQHTQTQAKDILANLAKLADEEDSDVQEEKETVSKIDTIFKALPRKLTLEIGEINKIKVDPVEYEVSESDLAEVEAMLKNPKERNNFLYNKEGGLNLTNIADVLTRNKMLESAVKRAYLEGGDRQVTALRKTFPALTAQQVGVGGAPLTNKKGQTGKLVSWSKSQVDRPLQHN